MQKKDRGKESKNDAALIINIEKHAEKHAGEELLPVRRTRRTEDSRIKIEAEVRIMHKRAALTRSTKQDQDRDLKKRGTREAKLGDKDNNLG